MSLAERGGKQGGRGQRRGDRADAELAGETACHPVQVLPKRVLVGEHPVRPDDNPLALRGEPPEAALPPDDLHPEVRLQSPDRRRQRRLRHMARGSGPREMSFPRESTEIFQLAQEHWTGIPAPRPEGKAAPRREPSRDGPAAQVATRRGVALEVGGADGVMCATRIDTAIAATLQERFSVKGVSWHPGQ